MGNVSWYNPASWSASDIPIVGNLLSPPKNVAQQPGAVQGGGGAVKFLTDPATGRPTGQAVSPSGQPLTRDPVTGGYVDPATGNVFDSTGAAVTDPNVAQQVAQNARVATGYQTAGKAQDASLDKVEGQQSGLATQLQRVIAGQGPPSVAATQLAQAQDATERNILGQTAGVSGPSAYDARRAAISAIATSRAQNAGNAALTRATEVNNATNSLAGVLNSQASGIQARQNTNVGAGANYASLAQGGQEKQQGLDQDTDKTNQQSQTQRYGATLSALGGAAQTIFGG